MQISLIITTYKAAAQLKKIFESLQEQTLKPFEVIIAEDGQDEETQEVVKIFAEKKICPVVHVRHLDKGYRKCLILNKAILQARGNYYIFLDGDCVPDRNFIQDHTDLAEKGYWIQGRRAYIKEKAVEAYLKGASLLSLFFRGQLEGVLKGFRYPWAIISRDKGDRGIIGCNLSAWAQDIKTLNGFDEDYDLGWGREDSDLAFRLYHLGVKRKLVHGRAIMYHLNHPMATRYKLDERDRLLEEVKFSQKIQCERGISKIIEEGDLGEIFRYEQK